MDKELTPIVAKEKDRLNLQLLILVIVAVLVKLLTFHGGLIEDYYSEKLFPLFAKVLRYLTFWTPFSLGDVLYIALGIYLLWKLCKGTWRLFKRKHTRRGWWRGIKKGIIALLLLYIGFNVLWGFNYDRTGITRQLGIKAEPYKLEELKLIDSLLAVKTNETKNPRYVVPTDEEELQRAVENAYKEVAPTYPFLKYPRTSMKESIFSLPSCYLGITGYYNPLTGEAQVNSMAPAFTLPYTACHEVAHQLGYAREDEANFVGYLAAAASTDTALQYSAYLDLFMYANREAGHYDSSFAKRQYEVLSPAVKADLQEVRAFWKKYRNPIEPVFTWLYGGYLRANKQPHGIKTYYEVTADLIAYYKKYGKL